MKFSNKIIWIIGASSGIGKALAIEFAKYKATIILSSRKEEALVKVKTLCNERGATCFVQVLDLQKQDTFEEITKKLISKFGRIDILINNGGISQRSLVKETPLSVDKKIMDINFFGNIGLTKAVLPSMIQQQSGHILSVSSIVGKFGFPLRSAYSASKHALHGFYETLRAEHKDDNIKVTMVIPGRVKTNISVNAITKDGTPSNKMDEGQRNGVTPEKTAKKILLAIRKQKKEVLIGGKDLSMVYIKRFLPFLYYRIVNKIQPR